MRKTMDFTDESVREMVLGAADAEKQISDIAELTGLTEDQIKEIAYSSPEPEPEPHRHRTYDWEKLDPRIVAMIRAGSTVEEIAGKLGIGFKSAARRCTALRKEIRSGEADAAPDPDPEPRPAQPDPTPEPEKELQKETPPEDTPGKGSPTEPLIVRAVQNILRIFSCGTYDRIEIDVRAYRTDRTMVIYRDQLEDL